MAGGSSTGSWPSDPSGYVLVDEIGRGAFASVHRALCESKDAEVAVKIISIEKLTTSIDELMNEVRTMRLCQHPNVLELYASFEHDGKLWLVTELMDRGSCYFALRMMQRTGALSPGVGFSENWIRAVIRSLLEGLTYLHDQRQIHRDVKAGNILLSGAGEVKIGDFGVAGWVNFESNKDNKSYTFVGTPCWMAPEVMDQQQGYDARADVWSVGITTLELARGYAPYAKLGPMEVLMKTLNEPSPTLATYDDPSVYGDAEPPSLSMSREFHAFVAKCLIKDPKKRPTARELLKDPFVSKADLGIIAAEVIPQVPVVGRETMAALDDKPLGYAAAKVEVPIKAEDQDAILEGTTWVFWDGTADESEYGPTRKEKDLEEGIDAFGERGGIEEEEEQAPEGQVPTTTDSMATRKSEHQEDDDDDDDDEPAATRKTPAKKSISQNATTTNDEEDDEDSDDAPAVRKSKI